MPNLANFNAKSFLRDHWQKKPLLLGEVLPDFECPITPDELAGLSLEESVESRIIIEADDNDWQLKQGPFKESIFKSLEDKTWTLLVQAVDQIHPDIHALKALFDFIPSYRLDDIMISYAPIGGSVGPHFDQYDVFLLQASGQRQWQVGAHCTDETPHLSSDVKVLANFEPEATHLLNPGDILYLPPGVSHHGISQSDDCMTISIGFRAPSTEELLDAYCLEIISELSESDRYQDPDLACQLDNSHPAEISFSILDQLSKTLEEHKSSIKLMEAFGKLMTSQRYLIDEPLELHAGTTYEKRLDARLAYFQAENKLLVFANGERLSAPLEEKAFVQALCENDLLETQSLNKAQSELIQSLLNLSIYDHFEEEPE